MAEGLSVAEANALLSAQVQGVAHSYSAIWLQLHVGAPGAAGTANIAGNNVRKDASACFGTAPSGGSVSNSVAIGPWSSVSTSETYTHFTLWTLVTGGAFILSGTITTAAITAGSSFTVPIGATTLSYPIAS